MRAPFPGTQLVVPPYVDQILDSIAADLQITQTQFARAERAYRSVGKWLSAEDSPLAPFQPEVYPQGSMALRTTVRPLREDEFDLDLVVEIRGWRGSAMALYHATGDRLADHGEYAKILEPKKRCWRLNYAGDFHLDALPGREDRGHAGNAIQIPDRDLEDWKPTNPRDYVLWFEARAQPFYETLRKRALAPLAPPQDPSERKDPLRRAVQLMKRHRDVRFDGDPDSAPRSVVLTTLAGKYYEGQESVAEAILIILGGILSEIRATDGPFPVPNPVNPDENFGDAWERAGEGYDEFVRYVEGFRDDLRELVRAPLGKDFAKKAGGLFGEDVAHRALTAYQESDGKRTEATLGKIAAGGSVPTRPWIRG